MSRSPIANHESTTVTLAKLQGASYNPRIMPDREMQSLMRSLREFGYVQPVVARKEDLLILGGHQRVEAMRRIAAEDGVDPATFKVPVILVTGLSDDKAKLLNVALNRIHGEWNYEKLGELFASVQATAPDAVSVSGFSDREIEDIMKLTAADAAQSLPTDEDIDVDAALAAEKRKFDLEVPDDLGAETVRLALSKFGMTSPANAGAALAKVAAAALAHVKCEEEMLS